MSDKKQFVYCDYSETIRQLPQNNMLAVKKAGTNMFIMDFDSGADKKMLHILLDEFQDCHESHFCNDTFALIKKLNSKL